MPGLILPTTVTRRPIPQWNKACYLMREGNSSSVLDSSVNNYHLSVVNGGQWVPGEAGFSFRNSPTGYLQNDSIAVGSGISTTESFWLHSWIRFPESYAGTTTILGAVSIGRASSGAGWGMNLRVRSNSVFAQCVATSGGDGTYTTTLNINLVANRWYLYSALFSHATLVGVYVNGNPRGATTGVVKSNWRTSTVGIRVGVDIANAEAEADYGMIALSTGVAGISIEKELACVYAQTRKYYDSSAKTYFSAPEREVAYYDWSMRQKA